MRILLVDDHSMVRSGLRLLLEEEGDFQVVGEAGDVDAALERSLALAPDVIRRDLKMPGRPSLPAIPLFLEDSPATRVVVLTMQEDPAFAREALQAGASAYVLKEAADDELVQAVRVAASGGTFLTPQLGARIAAEPPEPSGPPDDLTEREVEILRLIALGHTNAEIAAQLFLSVRTVESHRAHIQHKIRLTTRAELVHYALEHGLITV